MKGLVLLRGMQLKESPTCDPPSHPLSTQRSRQFPPLSFEALHVLSPVRPRDETAGGARLRGVPGEAGDTVGTAPDKGARRPDRSAARPDTSAGLPDRSAARPDMS